MIIICSDTEGLILKSFDKRLKLPSQEKKRSTAFPLNTTPYNVEDSVYYLFL